MISCMRSSATLIFSAAPIPRHGCACILISFDICTACSSRGWHFASLRKAAKPLHAAVLGMLVTDQVLGYLGKVWAVDGERRIEGVCINYSFLTWCTLRIITWIRITCYKHKYAKMGYSRRRVSGGVTLLSINGISVSFMFFSSFFLS